ncbi:MAG: H-NS histone family protein [Glaciimonas sp.]|nr:H-NS histone family protein [Glaciimonas sp.]
MIASIKSQVEQYHITAEEIYGVAKIPKVNKVKKSTGAPAFLYKNENGEGWSGARGRLPNWVKAIKDAGGDIEKYRV